MKFAVPEVIRVDFLRKVVALCFAILVWFTIDNQLHEASLLHDVPVMVTCDSSDVVLADMVYTVDVLLRGSRRRLDVLTSSDIRIEASVSPQVPVGIYFYHLGLSTRNVTHTPPGIRVSSLSPSGLDIRLDRIVTKHNVSVRVRYDGELRQGYSMIRHSVIPLTVDIKGPSKILKDIGELTTEPVVLDDTMVQDFEMDVRLMSIRGVKLPERVHVGVEIAKQSSQQAFHGCKMTILCSVDSQVKITNELPEISVTLYGSRSALAELDEHAVRPFIDISSVTSPGKYRQPVHVWIDGQKSLVAEYIHPKSVDVVLESIGKGSAPVAAAKEKNLGGSAAPGQVPEAAAP